MSGFYNLLKYKMAGILKKMISFPRNILNRIIDKESKRVNEFNDRILNPGINEGGVE